MNVENNNLSLIENSPVKYQASSLREKIVSRLFPNGFQRVKTSEAQRERFNSVSLSVNSSTTVTTSLSERSIQVVSRLTKAELEQQGFLFSTKDFEGVAGKQIILKNPQRVAVLRCLDQYEQQRNNFSTEENIAFLDQLEQKVRNYDKEISQKNGIINERRAIKFLLNGIALEKQRLLCEGSPYQPDYELSSEEASTAGEMTKPEVIVYFKSGSFDDDFSSDEEEGVRTREPLYGHPEFLIKEDEDVEKKFNEINREHLPRAQETVTGYFKSVGVEPMNSSVGGELGIPKMSTAVANLSGRAVAAYRVGQLLGLSAPSSQQEDLVPETKFALHDGKYGSLQLEAEGSPLTMEVIEEQTISRNPKVHNQKIVDVACGGLALQPGEALELKDPSLTINQNDCVCENGAPVSRRRASQLVEQGVISLDPKIITRFLEEDLEDSIVDTIRGDTALTLRDLQLKDPHLSLKKDLISGEEKIFENNQPITIDRAYELVSTKKIVRIKKMIASVTPVDFKNPNLQRDMSEAQMLDLVTGQLDRNAGNFIYQQEQEQWHAKLIDNDLSFPPQLDHIDYGKVDVLARSPVLKALPRLVDKKIAAKIASLTERDIASALQDTGLTQEEVQSTQKRLAALQAHLRKLPQDQLIDKWNDATYQTLMKTEDNYIYQGVKSQNLALESMKAAKLR